MSQGIEEIKLIIDLAKTGGMLEERTKKIEEELKLALEKIAMLEAENKRILEEKDQALDEKDQIINEKDKIISEKDMRIRELETIIGNKGTVNSNSVNADGTTQVVLIQQYILLDGPKTFAYVCSLKDDKKMIAGHMLMHTMVDNTPKCIYDQVNEMTQLEGNQTRRLADAMEKMADKPTAPPINAEHYYGDGATHDDHSHHFTMGETDPNKLLE